MSCGGGIAGSPWVISYRPTSGQRVASVRYIRPSARRSSFSGSVVSADALTSAAPGGAYVGHTSLTTLVLATGPPRASITMTGSRNGDRGGAKYHVVPLFHFGSATSASRAAVEPSVATTTARAVQVSPVAVRTTPGRTSSTGVFR